jgi:co-chaperonin GroES (HSP10)
VVSINKLNVNKKMEKLLRANHSNVVIKVIDNKYRKQKTDSGLIIPTNLTFTQETGQIEKILEEIIALAVIIDCGPECKYHREGDEVYIDTRSIRPIPFQGLEYGITNEQNIVCKIE